MRLARPAALVLFVTVATCPVFTQASPQSPPAGPTFEVVSIKRNTSPLVPGMVTGVTDRPDGGFTMIRVPASLLIGRAYPNTSVVGLPDWARNEYYDVRATSSLSRPTPGDRAAMMGAMLADRFKLAVHAEKHEQSVYDLVLARSDRRLGPEIQPVDVDCARVAAERTAAAQAALEAGTPPPRPPADLSVPLLPCTTRIVGASARDRSQGGDKQGRLGGLLEGDATMDALAMQLGMAVDRRIVNKTGLSGAYRVRMNFDYKLGGGVPSTDASTTDAPPSVFTALVDQLGLKLESSQAQVDTVVIDRMERPTEN